MGIGKNKIRYVVLKAIAKMLLKKPMLAFIQIWIIGKSQVSRFEMSSSAKQSKTAQNINKQRP